MPDGPPRKRETSNWPRRLLLIAGIGLFVAGIVATVGVPALDLGLPGTADDAGDEPPGSDDSEEGDTSTDDGPPEDDEDTGDADPSEEPPPDDDDADTPIFGGDDEPDQTEESDEEAVGDDEDTYTYSATVEVTAADSGEPIEGVPVEFYPVDSQPDQYTSDENGEVTIEFDHDAPDDSFEYVLAVGEGERIVEIEQGEQIESVPLSSDPEDLNSVDDD